MNRPVTLQTIENLLHASGEAEVDWEGTDETRLEIFSRTSSEANISTPEQLWDDITDRIRNHAVILRGRLRVGRRVHIAKDGYLDEKHLGLHWSYAKEWGIDGVWDTAGPSRSRRVMTTLWSWVGIQDIDWDQWMNHLASQYGWTEFEITLKRNRRLHFTIDGFPGSYFGSTGDRS